MLSISNSSTVLGGAQLRFCGAALVAMMVFTTGCGKAKHGDWPTTYPVTGTVVGTGGTKITAGAIQFQPIGDAKFTAMGNIQPDGTFNLQTNFVDGSYSPGAIPGSHRVTFYPYSQLHESIATYELARTVDVEAKDNTFEITVQAK